MKQEQQKRSKSQPPRGKSQSRIPKKTWSARSSLNATAAHNPSSVGTALIPTTDARVATTRDVQITLTNQLKTITIDKAFSVDNLVYLTIGYVSKALERGFAAGASTANVPADALQFMVNLLANYVQGQVVPVTELPYWLLCLGHALSPKSAPFGQGFVSYKFAISGTLPYSIPDPPTFPIGFALYRSMYPLGGPGGTPIDGFPVVGPWLADYTDQVGASAFQELCQFMATNSQGKQKRNARMVPSSTMTPFISDVSAWGVFALAEGTGSTGQGGGIYGQVQLEVPILHPLLSLSSCGSDSFFVALPTRNFNWAVPISGDPTLLGAMMSSTLSIRELSAKRHFRLKPIDFLEFGDVVAQWVQQMVQACINKSATLGYGSSDSSTVVPGFLCPLTLQEMLLILRNTIMGAFKESQAAVQGILPFLPATGTDSEFTSYVASATTCAIDTLDMHLPTPIIENIRALVARMVKFPASKHDIVWYLPILGQYFADALSSADYTVDYLVAGVPTSVSVFNAGALWERTDISAKGEVTKVRLTETPISLIDGAAATQLVFINDPQNLKILVTMWNKWFNGSGVSAFSVAASQLGTEKGINVLCSIAMTRIWNSVGGQRHRDTPSSKRGIVAEKQGSWGRKAGKIVDLRLQKNSMRSTMATVYALRNAVIDTSQGEILSAPYEQVQATWILPIDDDEAVLGEQSTDIQRWQFIMEEVCSKARSSGESGITLASLHTVYASKMVRSDLAPSDDWSNFFAEMSRLGRGGILSGLVAGFVGAAFPALGGIANTIASALPV